MFKSESGDIDVEWTHNKREWDVSYRVPFKYPIPDSVSSWHRMVEDYSCLHLTFPKDRLPALAAIVQRMMITRRDD